MHCPEDEDFMAAFDKMLNDTVQARNSESVKVPQLDIALPMQMRSQKHKSETQVQLDSVNVQHSMLVRLAGPEEPGDTAANSGIKFMLVTRKGNKQHFSSLDVPVSDDLAAKYKEREEVRVE